MRELMEKKIDEKKLSVAGLSLAAEVKNSLPYINNVRQMKRLYKALADYIATYKKLGGKIE